MKIKSPYHDHDRVTLSFKNPSMTKQSFKGECDINNIMKKWQATGVIQHTKQHNGQYGDFSDVSDYQTALEAVSLAQDSFASLPSNIRTRFHNSPGEFLEFMHNPANRQEQLELGLLDPVVIEASQPASVSSITENSDSSITPKTKTK